MIFCLKNVFLNSYLFGFLLISSTLYCACEIRNKQDLLCRLALTKIVANSIFFPNTDQLN